MVEVSDSWLRVRMDDGREVVLPSRYCELWVELGYACTADSAQGLIADQAIVVCDGMDNERIYVAATRSRRAPIYVAESAQHLAWALV
ncbi:MAG: hypothetical protein NZM04_05345 [Methylacidiphilales bacterium]|nr:hypothetical protein [Candidatus Methylacidiphilales bacterium]